MSMHIFPAQVLSNKRSNSGLLYWWLAGLLQRQKRGLAVCAQTTYGHISRDTAAPVRGAQVYMCDACQATLLDQYSISPPVFDSAVDEMRCRRGSGWLLTRGRIFCHGPGKVL